MVSVPASRPKGNFGSSEKQFGWKEFDPDFRLTYIPNECALFFYLSSARIGESALNKCTIEIVAEWEEDREASERADAGRQTKCVINANLQCRVIVRFSMWLLFFAGPFVGPAVKVVLPFSKVRRNRVPKNSSQLASGRK